MYQPNHFATHELVPLNVYKDRGEASIQLLDDRLLITLDNLRERYGRMTINNWYWSGDRMWSGLRTPDSPYYSKYSQHTFGRAADIIFSDTSAEVVRQDILSQYKLDDDFKYITSIELGTSWLHIDVRNVAPIFAFKP